MAGTNESALMQFAFRQQRNAWKKIREHLLIFGGCLVFGSLDGLLRLQTQEAIAPLSTLAGFTFASLLRYSWKAVPAAALGIAASNFLFSPNLPGLQTTEAFSMFIGIILSAAVLQSWRGREIAFDKAADIIFPFAFGGILAAFVSSLLFAQIHISRHLVLPSEGPQIFQQNFFAILGGIALVAPAIFLILQGKRHLSAMREKPSEIPTAVLAVILSLLLAGTIQHRYQINPDLLAASLLFVLLWIALHFGLRPVSVAVAVAAFGIHCMRQIAGIRALEISALDHATFHLAFCITGLALLILGLQRDTITAWETRARLSLEAADYCAWEWTFEGGIFFRSPAWCRRIGVTADKPFPLEGWIATVHPDEHQRFADAINAGSQQNPSVFTMRFRTRDIVANEWFWSKSIGIMKTDASGRPVQAVGIIIDIHDAIETENVRIAALQVDAELTALRSQLNPHFLFNCLNSIRALVGKDAENARQMITTLSHLLRYQLRANRESFETVEAEMAVVWKYLLLEQTRFGHRLQTDLQIDPRSLPCTIPGMLVLTLVENAVKHGISKLTEGGLIRIETSLVEKALIIRVSNSGTLDFSEKGIGLENTRRRIRLLAGQLASFDIHAVGEDMVMAEVILPEESLRAPLRSPEKPTEAI